MSVSEPGDRMQPKSVHILVMRYSCRREEIGWDPVSKVQGLDIRNHESAEVRANRKV